MLNQLDTNLWELDRPLKAPGLRLGHRMTVVRLANGELFVHSPVAYRDDLNRALTSLGAPAHFIAPSRYHDLHWKEWFLHFPKATFYCAPGVRDEHPELPFQRPLSSSTAEMWEPEITKHFVAGMPRLNEFVFLHQATHTLIVADLLFNLDVNQQNLFGKLFLKLNGIYGRPANSRIFRMLIRDKNAFKESVREIMKLHFDRIILGHGTIVNSGGKEIFWRAFSWL